MTTIAETERDLLAAALIQPAITETVALTGGAFDSGIHGAIWDAIGALHLDEKRPDPSLIVEHARRHGARVDHPMIVDLVGRPAIAANADNYAEQIVEHRRRRDLADALIRAKQALDSGATYEDATRPLSAAIDIADGAEQEVEQLMTLDEFVDQDIPDRQWVIPGLMARGDRLVLTGTEGLGKSMLARQLAVCTAAGVHPFRLQDVEPMKVLIVDCENPLDIMVSKLRGMRDWATARGRPTGDRLWVRRYPQGLDLAQVADRLKLHTLIRTIRPDLLYIGPAYKLYVGGANSREEDLARQVTSVLDGLREEFGFALILEHHSPHESQGQKRTVRPIGSSLWRRWPEFGFGLAPAESGNVSGRRVADVIHWRGARDERDWPPLIESGGVLPWIDPNPIRYTQGAA